MTHQFLIYAAVCFGFGLVNLLCLLSGVDDTNEETGERLDYGAGAVWLSGWGSLCLLLALFTSLVPGASGFFYAVGRVGTAVGNGLLHPFLVAFFTFFALLVVGGGGYACSQWVRAAWADGRRVAAAAVGGLLAALLALALLAWHPSFHAVWSGAGRLLYRVWHMG